MVSRLVLWLVLSFNKPNISRIFEIDWNDYCGAQEMFEIGGIFVGVLTISKENWSGKWYVICAMMHSFVEAVGSRRVFFFVVG